MKVTYYIDSTNDICLRFYEGLVVKEKLIESLNLFWSDPKYHRKQNHIIDFTKSDLELSRSEVIEVVDTIIANVHIQDRIVSFLVAKPQEAAITMMYKELSQRKHISEVFVSKAKALKFIEAPSDFYNKLKSKEAVSFEL